MNGHIRGHSVGRQHTVNGATSPSTPLPQANPLAQLLSSPSSPLRPPVDSLAARDVILRRRQRRHCCTAVPFIDRRPPLVYSGAENRVPPLPRFAARFPRLQSASRLRRDAFHAISLALSNLPLRREVFREYPETHRDSFGKGSLDVDAIDRRAGDRSRTPTTTRVSESRGKRKFDSEVALDFYESGAIRSPSVTFFSISLPRCLNKIRNGIIMRERQR